MTPQEQIVAVLEAAAAKIQQRLLNPHGKSDVTKEWDSARSAALLNSIRSELRGLKSKIGQAAVNQIGPAYRAGLDKARQQVRDIAAQSKSDGIDLKLGDKTLLGKGSFSVIDRHALQIIAQDTVADLAKAVDGMETTAQRVLRKTANCGMTQAEINRIMAGGLITGDRAAAVRDLREELIRIHDGKIITIIDKNGDPMQFKAGAYAEMVLRTKTSEAQRKGTRNRLGELGLDLVVILGSNSKNFCTAFVGRVFSLSGKSDKYPPLASLAGGGPPFHPNCSKSISAWVEELHTADENAATQLSPEEEKLLGKNSTDAHRTWLDVQGHQQRLAKQAAKNGPSAQKTPEKQAGTSGPEKLIEAGSSPPAGAGDFITDSESGQLLKPLGVSVVKLHGNEELGNIVIPPLAEAAKKSGVAPASVIVDRTPFKSAKKASPLNYNAETDRLSINPDWPHWGRVAERTIENHKSGLWSTANPLHIYYHEMAHKKAVIKLKQDGYATLGKKIFTKQQKLLIRAKVSEAAMINGKEFISEVFAMRVAKVRVDPQIMAIYTSLEGP